MLGGSLLGLVSYFEDEVESFEDGKQLVEADPRGVACLEGAMSRSETPASRARFRCVMPSSLRLRLTIMPTCRGAVIIMCSRLLVLRVCAALYQQNSAYF